MDTNSYINVTTEHSQPTKLIRTETFLRIVFDRLSLPCERNLDKARFPKYRHAYNKRGRRCHVIRETKHVYKYLPFCSSITIFFSTILGIATSFLSCVANDFLYAGEEKFGNGAKVFWSVQTEKYHSHNSLFVHFVANYEQSIAFYMLISNKLPPFNIPSNLNLSDLLNSRNLSCPNNGNKVV